MENIFQNTRKRKKKKKGGEVLSGSNEGLSGYHLISWKSTKTTHGNPLKTLAEQLVNKRANRWESMTEKENPFCQAGIIAMTSWLKLPAKFNAHILKTS